MLPKRTVPRAWLLPDVVKRRVPSVSGAECLRSASCLVPAARQHRLRWTEALKARDPALHATVMELMSEDTRKYVALRPEEGWDLLQSGRNCGEKKPRREKRRAPRLAQSTS